MDRRTFLRRSGAAGLGLAPAISGLALLGASAEGRSRAVTRREVWDPGYGPLVDSPDIPGIALPKGFRCSLVSKAGTPMRGGRPVPNGFDGTAAFSVGPNRVRLVRNHELAHLPQIGPIVESPVYDAQSSGGTTTVELVVAPDGSVEKVAEFPSLAGTNTNCAGGPTPWGSWLSCEETVVGTLDEHGEATGLEQNHGYVFEVPARADGPVQPVPLRALGRFVHEAVAIDPTSGIVYLTEDRDPSGFYRFLPAAPGRLAEGGRLQMLAVAGRREYDTRTGQRARTRLPVAWVEIEDPDPAEDYLPWTHVSSQGFAQGAARFARLEGCWYGDGVIYFDATTGGNTGDGQIWQYRPRDQDRGELSLVFESPSRDLLKQPDNLCRSPRGGLLVCEDSGERNYVRGVTRDGRIFDFARNDLNDLEWTGVCFAPGGRTLFVNIQGAMWVGDGSEPQGMTFAIWGPWKAGPL